ncbi:MAG: DUF393 domain-containing protein [Deltaproteobacteria bacterium]|nr:DUF393 domain-containing protein [Deltaproteobacteria bacterium]
MKKIPMVLFDGECAFCKRWILWCRKITGSRVDYATYKRVLSDYPQIAEKRCEEALQLITSDGNFFSGAHAIFKAFFLSGKYRIFLRLYENFPLFASLSERFYQIVANNRKFLSKLP